MQLIESILADAASIATIRRDIHAHPELCFQEERTADVIAKALTEWGIPIHRGLGKTGVVGIIKNGTSDRAVGLRADIDALPMTEHNQFAHASQHPGKMHACGHDGHTAMLLAAARHLARHRNFDGTVYLIFQPAEEGGGGAREMMKDGLFEKFPMEAVFGAHNWPGMKVGQFALKTGAMMASSNEFSITIHGKGSHAALPHNGIDPVPIACQMVQAFQTIITRNRRPVDPGVISVTMIHAGEALNVVPDSCTVAVGRRIVPGEVNSEVAEQLCDLVRASCPLPVEFPLVYLGAPAFYQSADTGLVRRLAEWAGTVPEVASYGTNALRYDGFADQMVVFGPGSIDNAHTAVEWVEIEQLMLCADVYRHWLGLD